MSSITILGTGTCQIQKHRMASSILVELGELRIVYDFGRGVTQRLVETGLKNNDINHIVLSHFHPDHISDLIPFLHAASWSKIDPRNSDLNIYGPTGVKVKITEILSLFSPDELTREHFKVHVHEIQDDRFLIDSQEFLFPELPPVNNHGLKFKSGDKIYAFTGDSDFHQEEIDFLKDVDFAVIDSGHITDDDIIELSVLTQAKIIICSHLYRELDEKKLNLLARKKGYKGNLIVGEDLMKFDI